MSDPDLPPQEPRPGDSGVTRVAFVRQIAGQLADRAGRGPAVHPAEKALDESRRLLELFFADSLDGFFFMMLDEPIRWDESIDKEAALDYVFAHDRISRVNPAMAAQYGASPEALIGRTPAEFYAHDPGPARTRWRGFFDTGRLHVETYQRKLDGTPIWIEGDYMCLYSPDGRIIGHFGIQRDITARHRAEEALRFSEEKFAKAFRACPLRVSIGTLAEGRFIEVNDAFLRDHGFTRDQVIGRTSPELGLWANPDDRRNLVRELERGGVVREWEFRGQTRDGQVQITSLSAELIQVGGEACILAVATDITDRKRVEQAIRSSREELRALAARLQSVREDERAHIAREVHDELGQALTGLKLDLAWLKPRLRDQVPLLERVQAVIGRIDGTIDAVRRIATELRPSVLDHLGLVAAVEWQAREFEKLTGIVVRLSLSSARSAVQGTVATTVFRMLQEALTNVARHAAATCVEIALEVREQVLTLRVADNGRGISPAERTDPHSLGLVGLRERAIACAGDLVIEGRPGEGTTLTVRIPLPLSMVTP
jgi:PAS domain S-box-containing protein